MVTSTTTAMPLLAPVAWTWSSSEYSACHCRSSSSVSTTSVPRCASTCVFWVSGMSWPSGSCSTTRLPDLPMSSELYSLSMPAAPVPSECTWPMTAAATEPAGIAARRLRDEADARRASTPAPPAATLSATVCARYTKCRGGSAVPLSESADTGLLVARAAAARAWPPHRPGRRRGSGRRTRWCARSTSRGRGRCGRTHCRVPRSTGSCAARGRRRAACTGRRRRVAADRPAPRARRSRRSTAPCTRRGGGRGAQRGRRGGGRAARAARRAGAAIAAGGGVMSPGRVEGRLRVVVVVGRRFGRGCGDRRRAAAGPTGADRQRR